MARKSASSSNIYGRIDHSEAIDIADRSMRGEFVHEPDSFGIVPGGLAEIRRDVIHDRGGENTAKDRARTHNKITPDAGNDDVTNNRASHERKPVDFSEAGAEAFRDQHGTARDED